MMMSIVSLLSPTLLLATQTSWRVGVLRLIPAVILSWETTVTGSSIDVVPFRGRVVPLTVIINQEMVARGVALAVQVNMAVTESLGSFRMIGSPCSITTGCTANR